MTGVPPQPAAPSPQRQHRGPDRRVRKPSLRDRLYRGRRKSARRAGEERNAYVDLYTPRDLGLLVGIFGLNLFDAFFTLMWLEEGGQEANPFMAWMLEFGDWAFLIQKCALVGIWLIFLIIHKNFRVARLGLYSLAGVYGLILIGHLALILGNVDPSRPMQILLDPSSESREQSGQSGFDAQGPFAQADRAQPGLP